MSLIQIENLTFSYSDTLPVFDGVSLHLDSEWKTGLVGRNGTGKTTFLNLLRGKLKGEGVIRANLPFVYFPCAVSSEEIGAYEAALEAAPCAELWQLQREINLLGLSEEVLYRPFKTLSGGERTRLMLAGGRVSALGRADRPPRRRRARPACALSFGEERLSRRFA